MSRVYCFCQAGCKYETMTKDDIEDAIENSTIGTLNLVTGTVEDAGSTCKIDITIENLPTNCFVEIYPGNSDAWEMLQSFYGGMPTISGDVITIHLQSSETIIGNQFIFMIKVSTRFTGTTGKQAYIYM